VRYFFRRRIPEVQRVLLVESGSRAITERLLPLLRGIHGSAFAIDLVTCFPGLPAGFPSEMTVYRVSDYAGRTGRKRLYRELRARGYSLLGIVCSAEPIMNKWKWALAAQIPAKVFLINENADYFWLDYSHWRTLTRLALLRAGLSGAASLRTLARLALFPFTLAGLLLYAAYVHTRRKTRDSTLIHRF
jgi:hypothetical protein